MTQQQIGPEQPRPVILEIVAEDEPSAAGRKRYGNARGVDRAAYEGAISADGDIQLLSCHTVFTN